MSLIKKTIPILIIVAIVASGVLSLYLYMNKTNEFPNSPHDPDIPVIPGSAIIVNHYHAHLEDFINIPNE
ncbi:MAG: hypothetical protein GF311_16180 [Candidatus Lokiarchaeota archaeon]|nr:hypothetical protein [Candidatus Lokiarchaeota archaeon]